MENVIITLKEEETRLKDKVGSIHREMSRLEGELMDCQERLAESEKLNIRQQRELDAVADLHRKVSWRCSSRLHVLHVKFAFIAEKMSFGYLPGWQEE